MDKIDTLEKMGLLGETVGNRFQVSYHRGSRSPTSKYTVLAQYPSEDPNGRQIDIVEAVLDTGEPRMFSISINRNDVMID